MPRMAAYLSHLFMEVSDLDAARRGQVDAIGLALLEDRGPYIRVGDTAAEGFTIGIEQIANPATREHAEITVHVDDLDATLARLESLGIAIEEGPADQPWGARHAWLRDPDGRRLSIYSDTTSSGS